MTKQAIQLMSFASAVALLGQIGVTDPLSSAWQVNIQSVLAADEPSNSERATVAHPTATSTPRAIAITKKVEVQPLAGSGSDASESSS